MKVNQRPVVHYIYNPQSLSKEDLISSFIVRQKTFERIFKEISSPRWNTPSSIFWSKGKGGWAKRPMLLRLSYEIERSSLRHWLIPLVFNEEEYSIRKLFKLWERIAELLEEKTKLFKGYKQQMRLLSASHNADESYEKEDLSC